MAIATDQVEAIDISYPQRWNIRRIQTFMLWFGPLSSVFDVLTFLFLLFVVSTDAEHFRTGWFVESLMTQLATMLVVRTPRPFWRSRPGGLLLAMTTAIGVVGVALPYLPFRDIFGFVPLSLPLLLGLVVISILFVGSLEAVKNVYFRGPDRSSAARRGIHRKARSVGAERV
jgi:Mg2+-importing ATPase